ncbi:thioredoxin family protein [Virgibacillus sediminis]|uniref:Thioredoxin family protein n=1 Tax=Virgibacillus sediminis TaxID=202260 RepID=A0ABV7A2Q5_9BACI
MELNDWFEKGMSPDTYIESMNKHKENLLHVYDHFQLPEDEEVFRQIKDRNLRAIILTEDWCGDAMMNVPVLLRLAEAADIDIRMLLRDENLELMDQYLTNGTSRSIPIFIFIDENGNEAAVWGPRAKEVQQFVDNAKDALPEKDAEGYEQKFKEMLFFMTKTFRDNQDFWLDTYKSIKQELKRI